MDKDKIFSLYNSNKGGINGALIGAILAIIIIIIGFFNTLFIAILSLFGYYIGKKVADDKEYFKKLLDKFLPPGTYR